MKLRIPLLFLLLLFIVGAPAFARTEYNDTAGVEVTFPDSWSMEAEDEDMRLREADRSSVVVLTVVEAADFEEAAKDIGNEMARWIDDSSATDEREDSFNGMPAYLVEGTGTIKGAEASWIVVFFEHNNKIVMVGGVAKKRFWDPNVGDILNIIKSVKPSK